MLLTVFGMLSGNGNKRQKLNVQACKSLQVILFLRLLLQNAKALSLYIGASILACNIVAVLLICLKADNGPGKGNNFLCYLQLRDSP
jgi:hypothetical protein